MKHKEKKQTYTIPENLKTNDQFKIGDFLDSG